MTLSRWLLALTLLGSLSATGNALAGAGPTDPSGRQVGQVKLRVKVLRQLASRSYPDANIRYEQEFALVDARRQLETTAGDAVKQHPDAKRYELVIKQISHADHDSPHGRRLVTKVHAVAKLFAQ